MLNSLPNEIAASHVASNFSSAPLPTNQRLPVTAESGTFYYRSVGHWFTIYGSPNVCHRHDQDGQRREASLVFTIYLRHETRIPP